MLKDDVLYALERQKGKIVTGGKLADTLGVSRTAVWKAVRVLQEEGNEITAIPNSGYLLAETSDALSEKSVRSHLTTAFVGQNMVLLPTVHSTNQYLKELDAANVPSGYAAIANEQRAGRGRRDRVFLSPKGAGLYLSVLFKLDGRQNDIRLLTICAAVAVSAAIEAVCGIKAEIKWVNDIFCAGKKICGILTEAVVSGELQELSTVIIGIGINTHSVPSEISGIATSVQEAAGLLGVRNRLAAEVLNQLEAEYLDYIERDGMARILRRYENRLFVVGQRVTVSEIRQSYAATVLGIGEAGALIVKDDSGAIRHITAGEIKLDGGRGG